MEWINEGKKDLLKKRKTYNTLIGNSNLRER